MFATETPDATFSTTTHSGRFNGAVACSRRRPKANSYEELIRYYTLQWGRRVFATETRNTENGSVSTASLQWGRRVFATETGDEL